MKLSTWCKRLPAVAAMTLTLALFVAPIAQAKLKKQNLVQLIKSSQSIVAGTVSNVTDGIDANGMPYTQVTIQVGASPKGNVRQGAYTFRQFGLLKPRTLPNGHRMVMVTPSEFPHWNEGEYVLAFLYHPAAKTGLQTTTGLSQGKFTRIDKKYSNKFNNEGLFDNISAAPGTFSTMQSKVLHSHGPVNASELMGLIEHVVKAHLVSKGVVK